MKQQLALLPEYLTGHLQLALVALLLGTAISVPFGIMATRVRWLEQPVLAAASIFQTLPGLAVLAVMVPTLAALGLPSIGYLPALIGLTLYSVLPIMRNTVTGILGVDDAVREAACSVGMTPRQQLLKVELPLAMPTIVAGLRTSMAWVIGIATLSTPVGAPSLGNYIFSGLQTRNYTAVLIGCVAAAVFALVLDGIVHLLERGIRERRRTLKLVSVIALILLYAYTGASFAKDVWAKDERVVTVGAKTFTEQYILSQLLAQQVTRETRLPTRTIESLGSTVAFDALRSGELDVYVEYTGTIWATLMHRTSVPSSREQVLSEVARYLDEQHGILLVGTLGFENAYALAMRAHDAARLRIHRISDLVAHAPTMSVGSDYEFFTRQEWRSIKRRYGLRFEQERAMDPSLMYQALAQGDVDVIGAYSSDGRITAFSLRVLEDDLSVIPPYDAIILASPRLRREQPNVIRALRSLTGTINAESMRRMNLAVDLRGESPTSVATHFLDRR